MRVEFSRRALADLESIYHHSLTEFGLEQADLYAETITATIQLITEYPAIAPLVPERTDNVRRRSVGTHTIYFIATQNLIRIIRVLHQRMDADGRI